MGFLLDSGNRSGKWSEIPKPERVYLQLFRKSSYNGVLFPRVEHSDLDDLIVVYSEERIFSTATTFAFVKHFEFLSQFPKVTFHKIGIFNCFLVCRQKEKRWNLNSNFFSSKNVFGTNKQKPKFYQTHVLPKNSFLVVTFIIIIKQVLLARSFKLWLIFHKCRNLG